MSTKQVSRAAIDNRQLRFVLNVNLEPVEGYVVGMDDYHWMIAQRSHPTALPTTALVHKGSTAYVEFTNMFLHSEDEQLQTFAKKVGASFWETLSKREREYA